jgi:aminopeptidase N
LKSNGGVRASLRRSEAEQRAADLKVTGMRVELDLTDPGAATFGSRTTIQFQSRAAETFVEFRGRELRSAVVNGVELDRSSWRDGRLPLAGLAPVNTLVVHGEMAFSSDGEGLHRHVDPEDRRTYLYAMSFLDAAPRWFACFDQPDLKAPYVFDIAAPLDWTILGNGPSRMLEPGRWQIVPNGPLATYFTTLVAGPYASVYDEHDGIRLGLHVRATLRDRLLAESSDILAVTKQCFDYYHGQFGARYPFGEYHQAFVPDFNAGAMENPGCVTFRDHFIYRGRTTRADRARRAGIIAHEMAHQWFGDLVTMRWWDDLWLNESFAEYLAHRCCSEATEYPLWTEFGIVRKDWGAIADQAPSTHPVAGNGADDAVMALQDFDGISYAKGAAVLKQLAAYIGEEVFFRGLRSYFDRYAFANASLGDLIDTWSAEGRAGLDRWVQSWLQTTGMDTIDVGGLPPDISVIKIAADPEARRSHAISVGAIDGRGVITAAADVIIDEAAVDVDVPADAALVLPDLRDATWAKIRFGLQDWSGVGAVLPTLADETASVVIYNAVRDAVRDAALAPALAIEVIASSVPATPSDLILASVLHFAQDQLAGAYCPVPQRLRRLARVHALARQILADCVPGSDRQLTAFRLAVRSAGDWQLLNRWYRGSVLPEGLGLDPELSWEIVERAASLMDDAAMINDALARDPSASAHVHAARARAALPNATAKEAAWAALMQPSLLPPYELYAIAEGFFEPGQEELTDQYVGRYFAEIAATADFRTGWSLGAVAGRAYPSLAASPATLELANQALAGPLAGPLRRALLDGTDALRRAVASLTWFEHS